MVKDATAEDSAEVAKNYIDNWIKRQLILQVAEKYLTAEQLDIERRVQDYKESLIIYSYENELIQQKLDTVVSQDEIEAYYQQYEENFCSLKTLPNFTM